MQENKYYYKGIPLSKYCNDNNINISTIRSRIWKKKKDNRYENYTEQEIIDMVIEAYGTNTKYIYKGLSLRQYCLENDISYSAIIERINNIKDDALTNDELVIKAIEEFDNKNYRFFYQGMPLIEYCNKSDINYDSIRNYINREKEKNPDLTDEELIEQYLNKEHTGIYKYYYLGIPLKKYCEVNNINYKNIISYISRNKDKSIGKTDDEFIEYIMDEYKPFIPKYMYKGITLSEYCSKHNISYYSVVSYVKRLLEKDSTKSIDELIDEGINSINRYGIIYYYKGIPLIEYAANNGLNASLIRCSILRKKNKSNKILQEIIDECVETYQTFSIKYYYRGIPLIEACKKLNINYNTVIHKYLSYYSDKDIEESIKEIVDSYILNPPVRTKYYINDQSLYRICNTNGYPYLSIYRRIKTLERNDETENLVETAIKKYEDRLHINELNSIFSNLKNNIYDIDYICNYLNMDKDNVLDLINMGFTYNQSINLIWYFGEYNILDDNKLSKVLNIIDNINSDVGLYELIGIYKSNLYDTRVEIINKLKKYIYKIINSICSEYEIKLNKDLIEEFESEIKYYILTIIDRICLNNEGQIVKYIDISLKGYFRGYLKKYKKQILKVSLNDSMYQSDKGTRKEKQRIDYIPSEELDDSSYSEELLEILSVLPEDYIVFINLKYIENYSDEEIAKILNLTVEEIIEKDNIIIESLRKNEKIKLLIKS